MKLSYVEGTVDAEYRLKSASLWDQFTAESARAKSPTTTKAIPTYLKGLGLVTVEVVLPREV